jgi:hypothetical protein
MSFQNKYLKYKNKYLDLKNKLEQKGGAVGTNLDVKRMFLVIPLL